MGSQEDISSELMRIYWSEIATKILVCMTSVVTVKFSTYLVVPFLSFINHSSRYCTSLVLGDA